MRRASLLSSTLIIASPLPTSGSAPALAAPANLIPPSISGTAQVGNTLVANPGSWSGNPTPNVTRQWRRNGVAVSGATGTSYLLTIADDGASITLAETASNSQGSAGPVVTNSIGPIANTSGGGGTVTISALTLTLTSGTADPPVITRVVPADAGEGDIIQRRIDTVSTYDGPNLRFEERVLLWNGTQFITADPITFVPAPFTIQTGLTPGVQYRLTERVRRDLGDSDAYSAWSNELVFTLAASGIALGWNPADRATWDGQSVSGTGNSIWNSGTGSAGAASPIRSAASFGSGKFYFRLHRTSGAGAVKLGVATLTYGGASGSLASVGDAFTNENQQTYARGIPGFNGQDIYVANALVVSLPGSSAYTEVCIDCDNDKIWFGDASGNWDGNPAAGTGGRTLFAGTVKALANIDGASGVVTIGTLAAAVSNAPAGFTPCGS